MGRDRRNRSTLERTIGSALLIAIGLGIVYRNALMPYMNEILLVLVVVVIGAIIVVINWRNRQYRMARKAARDSYLTAERGTQEPKRDP